MNEDLNPIKPMDTAAVWSFLEEEPFGRLAVMAGGQVDIFPVNYVAHERKLYFRTSQGSKLASIVVNENVAFEIDQVDGSNVRSVVVHGRARLVDSAEEQEFVEDLPLRPWAATYKYQFVVIEPDTATGRTFEIGEQPDHNPA